MTEIKILQIRDRDTNIAAMAVKLDDLLNRPESIVKMAGFANPTDYIFLSNLNGGQVQHDPYAWSGGARTMPIAHKALEDDWELYESGGVVCVEFILGEREKPKNFENL